VKAVSGKELCRILERHGWVPQRNRGSHHINGREDRPDTILVVPVHGNRSLKVGTQRGLMRDAGLTEADL